MEDNKIKDKIRALLASGSISDLTEAINKINEIAMPEFLPDLALAFSKNKDHEVRTQITSIFNNLKHKKAIPVLISIINNVKEAECLNMLVSASWQCGLDFSEHINVFIPLLLSEDFILAFDAYTVIENNIDFMDKSKADAAKMLLKKIHTKLPEKIEKLYDGLIEQLDSVS